MPGYLVTITQSMIFSDGCYCMGFIEFLIDAVYINMDVDLKQCKMLSTL
jgi:hypothetical protein